MMKYIKNIGLVTLWAGAVAWCVGAMIGLASYVSPGLRLDAEMHIVRNTPHLWYLIPAIMLIPTAIIGLGVAITRQEEHKQ